MRYALRKNINRAVGVSAVLAFVAVGTAFADNISKTFEFGEGTPQPRSNVRTFPVPCGTMGGVAAVVKYQRRGLDGARKDVPIIIELREPDTAPGQEGPIVETKTATATKIEQTVTLRSSQSSNRGCGLPWRVRVRYAEQGEPPSPAFGTIRLDFDGSTRTVESEYVGDLAKGGSVTKKIGASAGLQQGKIEITAGWNHRILGQIKGPNPIKLRFELINPNGAVVETAEGYSSNELRSELPKLRLIYQVEKCTPGQWKLKILNTESDDDALVSSPEVRFTPDCL